MDQPGETQSVGPTPPPPSPPAPSAPRPPSPPVIQVIQRPPGFGRIVAAIITAFGMLAGVFVLGLTAGFLLVGLLGLWYAGPGFDQYILRDIYREGSADTITVIPVRGVIDAQRAEFIRICVDEALEDRSVKAVVLRVDSGGGGVAASDQIWYQLQRLKKAGKPVVASYGSIAASGAYYVSCASDYIMAEETCITGSVGVIAQILTFEGLMDKVGVEPVTLVASNSPAKDIANDVFRSWTDEDRAEITAMLDAAYDIFIRRVRDGRSTVITDPAQVDELADGSIYTAQEAVDNGLIDGMGYLDDAIAKAEQLAGVRAGRATVQRLFERPPLFGGLPLVQAAARPPADRLDAEAIRTFVNELGTVRMMYLIH